MKHRLLPAITTSGLVFLACVIGCAGSNDRAAAEPATDGDGDGGTVVDAPSNTLPAGDLGKACAAGCAGTKICTVSDPSCSTGHCLFDARSGTSEAYCTADCSSAACPAGFVCEDVPLELKRACVRSNSAPNPLGPRVRGTVRVQGTIEPLSRTPKPYETVEMLDTAPSNALSNTPCGSVWLNARERGEPVLYLLARLCEPSVPVLVTMELPLRTASFPDGSALVSPVVYVAVEGANNTTIPYGSYNSKVQGVTIDVEEATDIDTKALPWKLGKLVAKISGTLPLVDGCEGTLCGGSKTITFEADLELSKVQTDEDGK